MSFPPVPINSRSWQISQISPSLAAKPVTQSVSWQGQLWMLSSLALAIALIGITVYGNVRRKKLTKELNFEKFKTKDFKEKLKLALVTINKMETNPDLIYSRAFNLDYLRMRMQEEVFHYTIVNQIKIQISQIVGEALRPSTNQNAVGVANVARRVEKTFDITYEVETQEGKWNKGVLFRIQIELTKLPTESSSTTISQIIDCIETFLTSSHDNNWQPAIHGRVVSISWDQKAKPTPLLVLQQSEEGALNVGSHPAKAETSVSERRS